jgi:two-component system, NtrC family, sensor kinase
MCRSVRLVQLSIATRIFVGFAVVLVTFGAVALFSVAELRRGQLESRLDGEGYLGLVQATVALETFQKNQSHDVERLRDEGSVETRQALIRLARLYFPSLMAERLKAAQTTLVQVRRMAPPAELAFLTELEKRYADVEGRYRIWRDAAEDAFGYLEQATPPPTPLRERLLKLEQADTALASGIRLLQGSLEAHIRDRLRQGQERERRTGLAIIGLSLIAILVGLLATGITARALKPVRTLIDGVTRIRQGDYTANLGVQGEHEIAVLAREFDAMATALAEREAQLKTNQEALLRAERLAAMGRVSAQVAHEVRNPLSSIGLNVEMLSDAVAAAQFAVPAQRAEATELLASVTREVDRLTEITEDYLRLARLPAPSKRLENLNVVIEGVARFANEELSRAGVTLQMQLPPTPVQVMVDEAQLRQVLLNLIRNSREAMPQGGTLQVALTVTDSKAQIRLSDSGAGIDEPAQAHLFEPFFTTKAGGTGLGLPLSRQILEAHGGRLELLSTSVRGTTFALTLPLS